MDSWKERSPIHCLWLRALRSFRRHGWGHYIFQVRTITPAELHLLISLAKHYAANPIKYSVVLLPLVAKRPVCVVQNILFGIHYCPFKNTFLTNLDLTGTGWRGIAVVNASVFKKSLHRFRKLTIRRIFNKIKPRGKAANSDHYWFSWKRGVPSFFIYAMAAHSNLSWCFDKAETLPLTEFGDLFKLIVAFHSELVE